MSASSLTVQLLNGLAGASSLFLVAAGLSLIFGVTRIVNFAHGSFYMLGLFVAWSLVQTLSSALGAGWGFWLAVPLAAVLVGLLGAAVEWLVLRRVYRSPELFQLFATFALVLVLQDAALWCWGAEDLLGPRAPGWSGSIDILGRQFPSYDLLLIAVAPILLALLWLLLKRTHWGILVRAATQDRDMAAALGVNQSVLFTSVFALGTALAGLGGALQLPREPAHLGMDLSTIGDAFVVVVIGGLGSIPGAYLAALLLGLIKALCIALGTVDIAGWSLSFSKLTLVGEFVVMAVVLVFRPWGLLGREPAAAAASPLPEAPLRLALPWQRWLTVAGFLLLLSLPWWGDHFRYATVLGIDLLIAALFAASLHFVMGPGALHSFGHAAYFGLGAYGAAWLLQGLGWPMEWALLGAPLLAGLMACLLGWFTVRLSGIYLAMLTLALAQIVWAIAFQWDAVTGGSNGLTGLWPAPWLTDKRVYYSLTLALTALGAWLLRRLLFSPFGYALRAARDSSVRAQAVGIDVKRVQWLALCFSGGFAGLAGALFVFSKGSLSPDALAVPKSIDALVMVLLGGVQTLWGPIVGAVAFTWLQDSIARSTPYWRALLGAVMLLMVLLFPRGLVGTLSALRAPLVRHLRKRFA